MIEGMEINVYFDDGQNYSFDLSPMQAKAVMTVLGITEITETSMNCYSDQGLQKIISLINSKVKVR